MPISDAANVVWNDIELLVGSLPVPVQYVAAPQTHKSIRTLEVLLMYKNM